MSYYQDELDPRTERTLFFGLDLGQAQDYTALAAIERTAEVNYEDEELSVKYNCNYLTRWALRTSYPQIVQDVTRMINSLPEKQYIVEPILAIDATGVGAPVVDLFKRETIRANIKPIQIIGGATVTEENNVTRVPKRELVSVIQVGLQNKNLKISNQLEHAATLSRELQNFQVKINDLGNDSYGAWREGSHDDLVLAVALALWNANKPVWRITERTKQMFRLFC